MTDSPEGVINTVAVVTLAMFVLLIIFFAAFLGLSILEETPTIQGEVESIAASDNILGANGSTTTLTELPNAAPTVRSKNRTWLAFDGSGDYINTNYSQEIAANHSYSFWTNFSYSNASSRVVLRTNDAAEGIYIRDGFIEHVFENATGVQANTTVTGFNNSAWNYVTVTINKTVNTGYGTASIYVNAVFRNQSNLTGPITTGVSALNISASNSSYDGSLDEFRLYNKTLTTAEITEIFNSGRGQNSSLPVDNLTLWYGLNERTGTTANELENGQHNGTITGATWATDDINVTVPSGAYSLVGKVLTILDPDFGFNRINALYNYNRDKEIKSTIGNLTSDYQDGSVSLFGNVIVVFTILGVILAISVIVILVLNIQKMKDFVSFKGGSF